jgi:hypothetical protein
MTKTDEVSEQLCDAPMTTFVLQIKPSKSVEPIRGYTRRLMLTPSLPTPLIRLRKSCVTICAGKSCSGPRKAGSASGSSPCRRAAILGVAERGWLPWEARWDPSGGILAPPASFVALVCPGLAGNLCTVYAGFWRTVRRNLVHGRQGFCVASTRKSAVSPPRARGNVRCVLDDGELGRVTPTREVSQIWDTTPPGCPQVARSPLPLTPYPPTPCLPSAPPAPRRTSPMSPLTSPTHAQPSAHMILPPTRRPDNCSSPWPSLPALQPLARSCSPGDRRLSCAALPWERGRDNAIWLYRHTSLISLLFPHTLPEPARLNPGTRLARNATQPASLADAHV